mmetsp:Transcript_46114/g.75224  ORF Transcript_46114/g.75224 Transcript_46114/m.75224 type:complete len:454 (-) Transcript_46114:46-1407(-)
MHAKRNNARETKHKFTFLVAFWLLNVFLCEEFLFHAFVTKCVWPDPYLEEDILEVHHVAIISNPTLADQSTFFIASEPGPLLFIVETYCDLYLKKAYRRVLSKRPDAIVILGDVIDGGREGDELEFSESLERYMSVFSQPIQPGVEPVAVLHVPGDRDVGLGSAINEEIVQRYTESFDPLNQIAELGSFSLVIANAPSLVTDDREAMHYLDTMKFIKLIQNEEKTEEIKILFTHLPLYRTLILDNDECGPFRSTSSKPFECTEDSCLPEDVSARITNDIKFVHVFSGHDNDWCETVHVDDNDRLLPETTIGTLSWMQGNWWPSFALVTLYSRAPYVSVAKCTLPSYILIFIWYSLCSVVTIFLLFPFPESLRSLVPSVLRSWMQQAKGKEAKAVLDLELDPVASASETEKQTRTRRRWLARIRGDGPGLWPLAMLFLYTFSWYVFWVMIEFRV